MIGRRLQEENEGLRAQLDTALRRSAELESQLAKRSGRDALTGLLDLHAFRPRLDAEVDRVRRHGHPLSVALLDVDGFRVLNAHHGHAAADAVLVAVGRLLGEGSRSHDLSCRSGADEFLVLLPDTDGDGALKFAERVLLELEAARTPELESISVSIGVAAWERGQTGEQLTAAAGRALDASRAAEGARATLYTGAGTEQSALAEAQRDAVAGLAVTLLERDRYTSDHCEAVVELATKVARGLGLPHDEVYRVRLAAQLHDVGKVGIPDRILHKPGPLDEDEWALMRENPLIGERILRAIPGLGGVARIVRHEHESYDGSGYPDGIAGDEIPIGSRIILVCDAYHAMTSDRPYRPGMTHAEAVEELVKNAGSQFDPRVTEALIGHLYVSLQG